MFGRKEMLERIENLEGQLRELKIELLKKRITDYVEPVSFGSPVINPGLDFMEMRGDMDALMDYCKLEKVRIPAEAEKIVVRKIADGKVDRPEMAKI